MKFTQPNSLPILLAALLAGSCSPQRTVPKDRIEKAHGIKLPASAQNFQFIRGPGSLDHGILSLFEMDQVDLPSFCAQLKIRSRQQPAHAGSANPCVNGWNVWPANSSTFVPGNKGFDGLRQTWKGEAIPVEMLSCASPKGAWLHVEVWAVGQHTLIKLYTDWN